MDNETRNKLIKICSAKRPSKSDEIEMIGTLCAALPDSYLRDLLNNLRGQFAQDVRSDFPTLPDILELAREVEHLSAQAKVWQKRRDNAKATHDRYRENLQNLSKRLSEYADLTEASVHQLRVYQGGLREAANQCKLDPVVRNNVTE